MYCWLLLLAAILVAVPAAVAADGDKDPYLWLEDVTGEKALAWVKERNAESTAELTKGPEFQALNERLLKILDSKEKIPFIGKRGEFYYNFGWVGLVLGMMTLGVWFRFLQESFLGMHATTPAMFAGVVTIVGTCTGIDGDLIGATNSVVFNVAPIVFAHFLVCAFTPAPARRPL